LSGRSLEVRAITDDDEAMPLRLLSTSLHSINLRTRIPFKFGIATMTAAPHLFVRMVMEVDGAESIGISADFLPPKWFTKNPATSYEDDRREMMAVITAAAKNARSLPATSNAFDFWQLLYAAQKNWAREKTYPPLLWNFGVSLIERAAIDAVCRAKRTTFASALRDGTLGFDPGKIHPELREDDLRDLLPRKPLDRIIVRHTVGLSDPLTEEDIPEIERVNDGLPQSLAAAIAEYGLTHFKIKLSGDIEKDRTRLKRVAELLKHAAPTYAYTLDGNENFRELRPFRELWDSLIADKSLETFLSRLIFVEQPIHRDAALAVGLKQWTNRPPIIIDESDAALTSLPTALAGGYAGTSHKNCKGIFKGLANSCLLAHRRRATGERLILSGEDLTNIGPVALMQDLAVMATLGIEHVERNGHHYFAGLGAFPGDIQQAVIAAHPDLYEDRGGVASLRIRNGRLDIESVNRAPFGYAMDVDVCRFDNAEA
jgi:hypothetical protein